MATVVKVQGSFASGGDAFGLQVERELKKAGVPVTAVHTGNKILVASGTLTWMADGPEIIFTYQPAVPPSGGKGVGTWKPSLGQKATAKPAAVQPASNWKPSLKK